MNVGQNRDDTIGHGHVQDWYRHVTATGDLTSGLLIAHNNDTVTELNQQARTHLAASNRLHGPTLEAGERVFQAGDRILCRKNQSRLGVLNGDLATVTSVDQEPKSLTVRLDRDPETRDLPVWYLEQGHVDYGYAMTGHKAQGVTTDRTFVIVDGTTDREWAYVAMSRGRQTNTLYLANPEPAMNSAPTSPTRITTMPSMASPPRSTAARPRSPPSTMPGRRSPTTSIRSVRPHPAVMSPLGSPGRSPNAKPNETKPERQTPGLDLAAGR